MWSHSINVVGSIPICGLLCEECLSPGTLASFHTHSGHMNIRLVGNAELSGLVSANEDGCLSLCIV